MIVGIPRELKEYENRVSLTPRSVSSLVMSGAKVVVESHAGERSGFTDDDYIAAGATIAGSAKELYSSCDLIVKVKEIQVSKGENALIRPGQTIFAFNHFESSKELAIAALNSKATFVSFEKVVDEQGQMPLLLPMSKIAGTIAGLWAGYIHNFAFKHDRSVRLKAGSEVVRSKIIESFDHIMTGQGAINGELKRTLSIQDKMTVVFGGGTVGEMVARVCSSLGAKLIIVEKRESRRKYLQELNLPKSSIVASADKDMVRGAHVVIGATYDKEKADRVIDEQTLKESSEVRKKILIDVSVDQGGNFPYISPDGKYAPESVGTIMNPAQVDYFGNVFVRVPNIPSLVPRYASAALSAILTEYVKDFANNVSNHNIANAVSIRNGKVVDGAIQKAHNLR
ncbi:MAG TPA: NAD(P)-dependent oxidoreductase [Nitrososphaera sp.]|nr:NAD(P)-dependent oxidoreductase [Nitrososphaera sp.]